MKSWVKWFYLICGCTAVAGACIALAALFSGAKTAVRVSRDKGVEIVDYTMEEHNLQDLDLGEIRAISLQTDHASVVVEEGGAYGIDIVYYTSGQKDSKVEYALENGVLTVTQTANSVNFNFDGGMYFNMGFHEWAAYEDRVTIYLPAGVQLESFYADSNYGDMALSRVTAGTLALDVSSGYLQLEEVAGGTVTIVNQYGEVDYRNSQNQRINQLRLEASNGDMRLEGVHADRADIVNQYGSIYLSGELAQAWESIKLEASNGDMYLNSLTVGDLEVYNDYGSLALEQVQAGSMDIIMENGEVQAGLSGADALRLQNNYGSVWATDWRSSKAEIQMENGDLHITGSMLGENRIDNNYGDVTLQLGRPQSEYNVDATTSYGDIQVDSVSSDRQYRNNNTGGANSLTITGSNSSIQVEFAEESE